MDQSLITTLSELYVPSRTLAYGIYELKLTVTMSISSSLTSSASVYVQIKPSGITANLVQLGTSMITNGHQQDLVFNPGMFSIDPDSNTFNASVSNNRKKYHIYFLLYFLIGLDVRVLLSNLWCF
jgi:hypothetical protein